jgi:hypothetical protein
VSATGERDDEGAQGGGAQGFAEDLEAKRMGTLREDGSAIGSHQRASA